MSRTGADRVDAYVECSECGDRRRLSIHTSDSGSTIRVGCPECRSVTDHEASSPRWFS